VINRDEKKEKGGVASWRKKRGKEKKKKGGLALPPELHPKKGNHQTPEKKEPSSLKQMPARERRDARREKRKKTISSRFLSPNPGFLPQS